MATVVTKFSADTTGLEKGVKRVQGSVSGLKGNISSITSGFSKLGGLLMGGAAVYGGVKAFQTLGRSISDSIKEAAAFETLSVSMEVLTGSAQKASKLLDEIKQFGSTTPLEEGDIQKATKTLLAFGVGLDEVMPTLRMLGDVSMGDANKLQSLALVFGQVSSAGRLMGGDVIQMINAGFNPLLNISKRLGLSMVETKKRMEDGGISIDMVKQSFKDATSDGGAFAGMLGKISNTTEGKLSNLSDNISQLKIKFGTGFNDGLKSLLDSVNTAIPTLNDSVTQLGVKFGTLLTNITPELTKFMDSLSSAIENGNIFKTLTQGLIDAITSDTVVNALKGIWEGIPKNAKTVGGAVAGVVVIDHTIKRLSSLGEAFTKLKDTLLVSNSKLLNDIGKNLNGKNAGAGLLAAGVGALVGTVIGDAIGSEGRGNVTATPYTPSAEAYSRSLQTYSRNLQTKWDNERRSAGLKTDDELFQHRNSFVDPVAKGGAAEFMKLIKTQNQAKDNLKNRSFVGPDGNMIGKNMFDFGLGGIIKKVQESFKAPIPNKPKFEADGYKPVLTSLARIGGAGALTSNPLVSIQKRSNELLQAIVKNTSKTSSSTATFA